MTTSFQLCFRVRH